MPNEAGRIPKTSDTPATVRAYGIWVFTWFMWVQPLVSELRMVVSEMGEQ